jgi:hypothetical protein
MRHRGAGCCGHCSGVTGGQQQGAHTGFCVGHGALNGCSALLQCRQFVATQHHSATLFFQLTATVLHCNSAEQLQ